jgi:hypothetical protein
MMDIRTYADVQFPFDTQYADDEGLVRLLACVRNDHCVKIIGYSYYGDPLSNCSQVLDWDENGVFAGGAHPRMDLVPPPGAVEDQRTALTAEIDAITKRLAENPNAPEAWRAGDERTLAALQRKLDKLAAPHIWERAA